MIRQAYTYLVGAMSAVVVIGVAIGIFVVLVCAQVFHELPIPALSGQDQKTAVAPGKALPSSERGAVAAAPSAGAGSNGAGAEGSGQAATGPRSTSHRQVAPASPTGDAPAPAEAVEADSAAGNGGGHGGSSGDQPGSGASQPPNASSPPSGSSSAGSGSGPKISTGTSGPGGSGGATGGSSGSSGAGGSSGSSGSSGSGSTTPGTPVTTAKPSEVITETVNNTVGSVDEAVGGTLSEVGVTHVTEEVVNGVAGPESVVGKTVDGVREVIGGLTGGGH